MHMSPDARFQVIIALLSLLFVIFSAALGILVRVIVKFTKVEDKVGSIVEDMTKLVEDKEKIHTALYEQMKEDRKATDERLRWLERTMWPRTRKED